MRIAIPTNLVNYIRIRDNEIIFKRDLPNELQNDYEKFEKEFKKSLTEFKSNNKLNERNVKMGKVMKSISNKELTEIRAGENNLEHLDLKKLSLLKSLHIGNNKIKELGKLVSVSIDRLSTYKKSIEYSFYPSLKHYTAHDYTQYH